MHLNLEIINKDKPSGLNNFTNACFKPFRYLFNGRTVEILNGEIVRDAPSYSQKSFLKTVLAIITLVPGLIVGLAVRLFEKLTKRYKDGVSKVEAFDKKGPTYPDSLTAGAKIQSFHSIVKSRMQSAIDQIGQNPDIWESKEFIAEVNHNMAEGYRLMDLYFRTLSDVCSSDAKKMADEMTITPDKRVDDYSGEDFSKTFFTYTAFYHNVRASVVRYEATDENRKKLEVSQSEPMPFKLDGSIPKALREPYFNPTKPQYQWRVWYNGFCGMLDSTGVRKHLAALDKKYTDWSKPDLKDTFKYNVLPGALPT